MQLFIHIGYPKTGSSAIQWHVFTNRKWFLEHGIYVPETGYGSELGHAYLVGAEHQPFGFRGEEAEITVNNRFREMATELERARDQGFTRALVTWEGFALASDSLICEISQEMSAFDTTILAYVRDQVALCQSAILQRLEGLRNVSWEKVLGSEAVRPGMFENYDFHKAFQRWKLGFDESVDIRVRVYDKERLVEGNVVKDFLDLLGITIDESFALQTREINHSIDKVDAALILLVKALGIRPERLFSLISAVSHVAATKEQRFKEILSDQDRKIIEDYFVRSNHALLEHFKPENVPEGEPCFMSPAPAEKEAVAALSFTDLSHIYTALQNPPLPVWGGGVLQSHKLARVARAPNKGWRASEEAGVWSQGEESEIAFYLPDVHPEAGPSAIRLVLEGHYFEGNSATRVSWGGNEAEADLSRAEFLIDIDATVMQQGMKMILKHQNPQPPPAARDFSPANALAYKLTMLHYDFIW